MRRKSSDYPGRKKVAFGVFLAVGGVFSWSLTKNLIDLLQLGNRLDEVRLEVQELESQNYTLREKVALVETEGYQDREIRDKLGLVKPGEAVVIIPEELMAAPPPMELGEIGEEDKNQANWEKWRALFF